MSLDKMNLATVEKMWRREVEAAATYQHLANRETDQKRKDILMRLAAQEDKHAARWSERAGYSITCAKLAQSSGAWLIHNFASPLASISPRRLIDALASATS